MPKIMHAAVSIDLPVDEFEEATAKIKVKPAWDVFLKSLKDAGVLFKHELVTNETKARTASGAKRGPKPRAAATPASGEAAVS